MFSVSDHHSGSPVSSLTPRPPGPRNCVQSAARAAGVTARPTQRDRQNRRLIWYTLRLEPRRQGTGRSSIILLAGDKLAVGRPAKAVSSRVRVCPAMGYAPSGVFAPLVGALVFKAPPCPRGLPSPSINSLGISSVYV